MYILPQITKEGDGKEKHADTLFLSLNVVNWVWSLELWQPSWDHESQTNQHTLKIERTWVLDDTVGTAKLNQSWNWLSARFLVKWENSPYCLKISIERMITSSSSTSSGISSYKNVSKTYPSYKYACTSFPSASNSTDLYEIFMLKSLIWEEELS